MSSDLTTNSRTTHTLLGDVAGCLVLRVANTSLAGREYRVSQLKATLGSSASCTICLPGLAPLHALILRGSRCHVVRKWAPDARLNGHDFTDALLREGDRLSLGAFDFEVLAAGTEPNPDVRSRDLEAEVEQWKREAEQAATLRTRLDALQSQEEVVLQQVDELRRQLDYAQEQLRSLQTEQRRREQEERDRHSALLDDLHGLRARCEELCRSDARLRQEIERLEVSNDDLRRTCDEANRDRERRVRQIAELQREVERVSAELESSEVRRRTAETQLAELQEQRAAWAAERDAAAATATERAEAESKWAQVRESLEREIAALKSELAELTSARDRLEDEVRALRERSVELEELLAEAHTALRARDEQVTAPIADDGTAHVVQDAPCEEDTATADADSDSTPLESAESDREDVPATYSDWQSVRGLLDQSAARDETDAPVVASTSEFVFESSSNDEPSTDEDETGEAEQAPAEGEPSNASEGDEVLHHPADSHDAANDDESGLDVLERLRRAGVLRGDREGCSWRDLLSDDSEAADTSPVSDMVGDGITSEGNESAKGEDASEPADDHATDGDVEDDDESIQRYMDRLLNRMRGEAENRKQPTSSPERHEGSPSDSESVVSSKPILVEFVKPEEFVPRSSAPELNANLAAMRALANDSARSALDTYARRKGKQTRRARLTYASVATFGGLAFLLFVRPVSPLLGLGAAGLCFLAAAFLGISGAIRAARM